MLHKLLKKELKKMQINHFDDYIRFSRLLESGFALYMGYICVLPAVTLGNLLPVELNTKQAS